MSLDPLDDERQVREAWDAVQIVRPVHYTLFTFGESVLSYYLVCERPAPKQTVSIRRGDIRITRPLIITPESGHPVFDNFLLDDEGEAIVDFLLERTAAFSNLRITNESGPERIVTDSLEEAVSKLNQQLDAEEEDRVAILTAPERLAGVALIKYATERILASVEGNIQELRERGFLP
ncbi:MAG TPA: hypothetical protein EYP14_03330 [Planctomycetaceae bacterium]|nr:hypothetical protein [Planctomycetaceae bacterium]